MGEQKPEGFRPAPGAARGLLFVKPQSAGFPPEKISAPLFTMGKLQNSIIKPEKRQGSLDFSEEILY
jgi:hypothetical protein